MRRFIITSIAMFTIAYVATRNDAPEPIYVVTHYVNPELNHITTKCDSVFQISNKNVICYIEDTRYKLVADSIELKHNIGDLYELLPL